MVLPILQNIYQRLFFLLPLTSESWNYDNPNLWFLEYPTCIGLRQSPIAINTNKVSASSLPPLQFGFYDDLLSEVLTVRNNGHTVEWEIPDTVNGERPYISGGLLDGVYEAESAHFHWGSRTQKGSEHVLNGRRYDLEMHIVHKNIKYDSIDIARANEDGLAVLGVLFKVVKSPNVFYPSLNEIYDTLEDVVLYNSTAETTSTISLGSLLANINRRNFYAYRGSLTTPPCSESVTWHVFQNVVPISYVELRKFWNILDTRNLPLLDNFRPLQPKKLRKVYHRTPRLQYLIKT